jgi:hypothetical protein
MYPVPKFGPYQAFVQMIYLASWGLVTQVQPGIVPRRPPDLFRFDGILAQVVTAANGWHSEHLWDFIADRILRN